MIMNTPQIQDFAGKRIHMIGIGGSSMSGLAQMLQHLGYQVTGSDQNDGYLMNDGCIFRRWNARSCWDS